MLYLLLIPVAIGVVVSQFFRLQALAHLSEAGEARRWHVRFWFGLLTGREYFTATGWRFRNWSLLAAAAGVAAALLMLLAYAVVP
jgi:hypothetical protein